MPSIRTSVAAVILLAGCAADRGYAPPEQGSAAATIALSVASTDPMTSAGDTRAVAAVVRDAQGTAISAPVLWRTSAPAVAAVTPAEGGATVTAVDDGTATITATSGGVEATVSVVVRRRAVAIELSAAESVVLEGSTTQLTVIGRDARQQPMTGISGVTFATDNAFSVIVSPTGLATALFSSARPFSATITARATVDGTALSAATRIDVASAAPDAYDTWALMLPEDVRPDGVNSAGAGIAYFRRDGDRVLFQLQWALFVGAPRAAHIHGPDAVGADTADVLVELPIGAPAATNGTVTGSFSAADIRARAGEAPISLDSLVALMKAPAQAYVDVHSTPEPNGEVRGPSFLHP